MGYNREPTKRRRFDVPVSSGQPSRQRRKAQSLHRPRSNETSSALIDAGIVTLATLVTTVLLLAISGQIHDTTDGDLIAQSPAPLTGRVVTAQPTPQPSFPLSSPQSSNIPPTPSVQPTRPAATGKSETETAEPATTPDDAAIQAAVDKKLLDDSRLSALGITATVSNGKVILVGTAPTDEMKNQVEKLVRGVKGVKQVDNQIVVISNV